MAGNSNTTNSTLREILGSSVSYIVPPFQRDYAWGRDQRVDLWYDISDASAEGSSHYLGYLVLHQQGERTFGVVDGQQRLTTISLLVLAAIKQLQDRSETAGDADATRAQALRADFIGSLDPITLRTESKLQLNRNSNEYYQKYSVPLKHLPARGITASARQLRKVFEFFSGQISDVVGSEVDPGQQIARLVAGVMDHLFVTQIRVDDDTNSYTVFETLNARGVRLSSTDLLKNNLFSVVHGAGDSNSARLASILRAVAVVTIRNSTFGKETTSELETVYAQAARSARDT